MKHPKTGTWVGEPEEHAPASRPIQEDQPMMEFLDSEIIVTASDEDSEVNITIISPEIARDLARMVEDHAEGDIGWIEFVEALTDAANYADGMG